MSSSDSSSVCLVQPHAFIVCPLLQYYCPEQNTEREKERERGCPIEGGSGVRRAGSAWSRRKFARSRGRSYKGRYKRSEDGDLPMLIEAKSNTMDIEIERKGSGQLPASDRFYRWPCVSDADEKMIISCVLCLATNRPLTKFTRGSFASSWLHFALVELVPNLCHLRT